MFIHYLSDISQSYRIVRWLMGGLDITDYKTVISILPFVLIGLWVLLYFARDLNLISTGTHSAMSRGVEVAKVQRLGLLAASLITGAVVAISGPIGFVGLIVPHIVRLLIGPDQRDFFDSLRYGCANDSGSDGNPRRSHHRHTGRPVFHLAPETATLG
jgi:iron complex transport system permease protein